MRYFLEIAYDGSAYHGWQVQPNAISVQQVIEEILHKLLGTPTPVVGAGRTDAGVHAKRMFLHFDTEKEICSDDFVRRLNSILPQDISVYAIHRVKDDAHARFDATYRIYNYYITNVKSPFTRHYFHRYYGTLNFDAMNQAAERLKSFTDFTSFSKLHTDTVTNNCCVMDAHWEECEGGHRFVITADRFLRNMVRSIVGTLIEVGRGKLTIEEFCKIIEAKDRCKAGTSMPGNALFLVDVGYPDSVFSC